MYKLTLLFLTLVAAPFASGQSSASLTSTYQPASHTATASFQSVQSGVSLIANNVTIAAGEMPLSDVPLPPAHEEPLGNVARRYRQLPKDAQVAAANSILKKSSGAFPGWWLAD